MTGTPSSKSATSSSRRRHGASVRTSLDPDAIADALIDNLHCLLAKRPEYATLNDWYMALAYTVRDRALEGCIKTLESMTAAGRMSIINAASVGRFSSDRSIRDYCRDIWNLTPVSLDEKRT